VSAAAIRKPFSRRLACPFFDGTLAAPHEGVQAVTARAVRRDEEEEEAVENGRLALVLDRPEALRCMCLEVRDGHFPGSDERGHPSEKPDRDENPPDEL